MHTYAPPTGKLDKYVYMYSYLANRTRAGTSIGVSTSSGNISSSLAAFNISSLHNREGSTRGRNTVRHKTWKNLVYGQTEFMGKLSVCTDRLYVQTKCMYRRNVCTD